MDYGLEIKEYFVILRSRTNNIKTSNIHEKPVL